MEAHLTADVASVASGRRRVRCHWRALLLLVFVNLVVVGALWGLAMAGLGRYWLPLGYDLIQMAAGAVLLSQYLVLSIWLSLSEPRSPLRWLFLVVVCALAALIVAVVFYPAWQWQFIGGRWYPWGIVFWELYVNFMLVLCSGIVFLLSVDIMAWPCRRVLGCRITYGDQPAATPAARGFSLTEMFWWVGMAAAGCWLLREMLENTLAEYVAIVLVMLACVIPAGAAGVLAGFTARSRWLALTLTIAFALAYGGVVAGIFAAITSVYRSPQNSLLAYVLFIPWEVVLLVVGVSALGAFANASALRWSGARLAWSLPTLHRRTSPLRS